MNYLRAQNDSCNKNLIGHPRDEASWPSIVDLIFDIVAHRNRLAIKRKAFGRHKRRLARRQKRGAAR
jgi:hypothetical protein